MRRRSPSTRILARTLWLAVGATALAVAHAAEPPPAHLRGTITAVTADSVTVQTTDASVSVSFDVSTRIAGIVPSSVDKIKPGTFVGIANVPGNGSSAALEVVVFPEAMKGSGLGDYPWDLDSKAPSTGVAHTSAMTNGTVKSSSSGNGVAMKSAMTNGTVGKTSTQNGSGGLTLTVDYGQGEKTITVPNGVPIVGVEPGDASKLVKGAHVFIATKKDAPKSAGFIAVGINGTIPPM